jgi:hypothetical protein
MVKLAASNRWQARVAEEAVASSWRAFGTVCLSIPDGLLSFFAHTLERLFAGRFYVHESACLSITFDVVTRRGLGLTALTHCANSLTVAGRGIFCHTTILSNE